MKAYLYVLDTLADWEIGYIAAELHSGRYLDRSRGAVTLIKIANTMEPVVTMGGTVIVPDKTVDDVFPGDGDLIILPGADTWLDESNRNVLDLVSGAMGTGTVIAAICGATAALARRGIFEGRKHTSNDKNYLNMVSPGYAGNGFYRKSPVVVDGNLITATGLAPLEFSREVFRETGVMKDDTLEAWFKLYKTRKAVYYHALMESLK